MIRQPTRAESVARGHEPHARATRGPGSGRLLCHLQPFGQRSGRAVSGSRVHNRA